MKEMVNDRAAFLESKIIDLGMRISDYQDTIYRYADLLLGLSVLSYLNLDMREVVNLQTEAVKLHIKVFDDLVNERNELINELEHLTEIIKIPNLGEDIKHKVFYYNNEHLYEFAINIPFYIEEPRISNISIDIFKGGEQGKSALSAILGANIGSDILLAYNPSGKLGLETISKYLLAWATANKIMSDDDFLERHCESIVLEHNYFSSEYYLVKFKHFFETYCSSCEDKFQCPGYNINKIILNTKIRD